MKKENNEYAILGQLLEGKKITTTSVLSTIGTTELRHYIAKIRKYQPVSDEKRPNKGEHGNHKAYFIPQNQDKL